MPLDKKLLPEPMLTMISTPYGVTRPQRIDTLRAWTQWLQLSFSEWLSEWLSLTACGHRGPYSPCKPCNHSLRLSFSDLTRMRGYHNSSPSNSHQGTYVPRVDTRIHSRTRPPWRSRLRTPGKVLSGSEGSGTQGGTRTGTHRDGNPSRARAHTGEGGNIHNDVIKWKHFPRYWPFVPGIHRSPVNSPHKGQWRGALMFSLICTYINSSVNNREAGDLRRYRAYYDVNVMLYTNDVQVIPYSISRYIYQTFQTSFFKTDYIHK